MDHLGRNPTLGNHGPMSAAGWSDAPADLLWKIIVRLPITDYIRFGAVCVPWFRALSEKRRPPAQAPLLLLPGERSGVRFFIQSENKEYHLYLPEMGLHHKCIGSSPPTSPRSSTCSNLSPPPRTSASLPSPPSPTSSSLRRPLTCKSSIASISRRWSYHPRHPSWSPASAPSPISWCSPCQVTNRGDQCLVAMAIGYYRLLDIIFYRGNIYGTSYSGRVIVFDLSDLSHPKVSLMVQAPTTYRIERIADKSTLKYLVESPVGDLLQICRTKDIQVTKVWVFKMIYPDTDNWIELKSLGDFAIFLGHNHSLAMSTHDLPELRKNCKYFTDNRHNLLYWHARCNLGIYNMENESFSPYYPSKFRLSRPQVWFDSTHL